MNKYAYQINVFKRRAFVSSLIAVIKESKSISTRSVQSVLFVNRAVRLVGGLIQ